MNAYVSAVFAVLISSFSTEAAVVQVFSAGEGELVFIDGEIEEGDLHRVKQAVAELATPAVLLRSPGGDAREGMAIGRYLRSIGASTGVAPDFLCASACAMIWVAGANRYLAPTSLIGFHGAYTTDSSGLTRVSGWGNALVGAYLFELGFSETAIIYMTAADPSDLNWVNRSMALSLDIAVFELDAPNGVYGAQVGEAASQKQEVSLSLPSGFRWIVLESKEDPNDIFAENWEDLLGKPVIVVKTRNGFSAAAVGPFEKHSAEKLAEEMRASGLAPEDVYLSSGNGFVLRLR